MKDIAEIEATIKTIEEDIYSGFHQSALTVLKGFGKEVQKLEDIFFQNKEEKDYYRMQIYHLMAVCAVEVFDWNAFLTGIDQALACATKNTNLYSRTINRLLILSGLTLDNTLYHDSLSISKKLLDQNSTEYETEVAALLFEVFRNNYLNRHNNIASTCISKLSMFCSDNAKTEKEQRQSYYNKLATYIFDITSSDPKIRKRCKDVFNNIPSKEYELYPPEFIFLRMYIDRLNKDNDALEYWVASYGDIIEIKNEETAKTNTKKDKGLIFKLKLLSNLAVLEYDLETSKTHKKTGLNTKTKHYLNSAIKIINKLPSLELETLKRQIRSRNLLSLSSTDEKTNGNKLLSDNLFSSQIEINQNFMHQLIKNMLYFEKYYNFKTDLPNQFRKKVDNPSDSPFIILV